jgi:hypothetical protein
MASLCLLILKLHYSALFLGSDLFNDFGHANRSYKFFIETFLYYQRLFEYGGDIEAILSMPYCLYNDLILEQVKLKKKELRDLEEKRKRHSSSRSNR